VCHLLVNAIVCYRAKPHTLNANPKPFDPKLELQLAIRCHRSRRVLAACAARRAGNEQVDFARMARRLLDELEAEQEEGDLFDFIGYAVGVLGQLPEEFAAQVRACVCSVCACVCVRVCVCVCVCMCV